jgi:hypothetical protein
MIPSARSPNDPVEVISMRALDPEVVDAVWEMIEPMIPRPVKTHPLGCHRRRISNRLCF